MTTPLPSQSHRLNTRGRYQGGDSGVLGDTRCHLMVDSTHHLGVQDLNHRTQTNEDLQLYTQCCVSAGSTTVKDMEGESSKAATRRPRPRLRPRFSAHARRFWLQPRARGADDFRQNIFVPAVTTPLPAVHKPTRTGGTGTAWNAQIYVPERPHSSTDIIRTAAAATTPSVIMRTTKHEKEEEQEEQEEQEQEEEQDDEHQQQQHEQREQQPKSRFQVLQDLDEEQTHELIPPSPLCDSSRFQPLRPPLPMYDSYTTSTSSPYSVHRGLQHRGDSIGESQLSPLQVPHHEPEKQQEQQQQQEHQPPHMLSMSCNHTDNTMTTEDDDTIASFFILDDDISEVTWEGDWDFHKHQQELYQYHQYQQQQQLLQQQQQEQQEQEQATYNEGKKGAPSWSRFLRPNRDRLETANTDGATAAMHTTIPSCISVAVSAHHHHHHHHS
jgi:hypothetical protein